MVKKIIESNKVSSWTAQDFGTYMPCIDGLNNKINAEMIKRFESFDPAVIKAMFKSGDCQHTSCFKVCTRPVESA